MTKKIRSTSASSRSVVSTSKRYRSIDKAQVAEALGADETFENVSGRSGSPSAQFALHQKLCQLQRTGIGKNPDSTH